MGSNQREQTVPKNPKRVAAGRANRAKRGPLTPAGRERMRQAALANRPWVHSTGPKTEAGKRQAARNGKARQLGPESVREVRRELHDLRHLLGDWREERRAAAG